MRKELRKPRSRAWNSPGRSKKDSTTRTGKKIAGPSFPIVGIGASAGGLQAFTSLLGALPSRPGLAFIFIQHLDPHHSSMLSELLSRSTPLPVSEVKDGEEIKPDRVYVIPPNTSLTIAGDSFHLKPRSLAGGQHLPVDVFLRSLAQERRSGAIGVVLSGTASDGTLGLKAIKAEGGITFAQNEASAGYFGMPYAAIASGAVDYVLPPEEIARELARMASHPYLQQQREQQREDILPDTRGGMREILRLLHRGFGTDFSEYKMTTVKRRIRRRMVLQRLEDPEAYARFLREHAEELEKLYQDVLINVTSFLREPDTFESLKSNVFPAILADRPPDSPIRIWVPGCATGEEAYSIVICLLEYLEKQHAAAPIQIFGTDASKVAIDRARTGAYLESIALDVSSDRLQRFFVKTEGSGFRVNPMVRDMCIFAQHDLTKDPPFSRLDLISCRNVLIYLGQVLQEKILQMFHYALKPHGFLMLGSSETVGSFSTHFLLQDRKNKIYMRKESGLRPSGYFPVALALPQEWEDDERKPAQARRQDFDVLKEADRIVQNAYAPAGVVINEAMEVLQFRGRTSDYLEPAPGHASFNLLKMAREGLLPDLRAAIREARGGQGPVHKESVRLWSEGKSRRIHLSVHPITGSHASERFFLVLFDSVEPGVAARKAKEKEASRPLASAHEHDVTELRREITATKDYLHSIVEEQDRTNEELKSANEEIQSSNEELQSTNEELVTAKEELQSTNEKLTTLNEELANRNRDLGLANNDLSNLLTSIQLPLVMLTPDLRIRRFTPQAEAALNLLATDIGRPLSDLQLKLEVEGLEDLILNCIETVGVHESKVQDREGRWYHLWIRPYRTAENRIDGAILALFEIDDLKRKEEELQRFKFISDNANDAHDLVDEEGRLIYVNRRAWERLGYSEAELLSMRLWDIDPLCSKEKLTELFQILQKDRLAPFESQRRRKDGSIFPVEVSVTRVSFGEKPHLFIVARDITERKLAEEKLREAHDGLERRVADRTSELNRALRILKSEMAERQRAEETSQANERRYRDLFDKASDVIYTIDLEGNFSSINTAAESVLGYSREEASRMNLAEITSPDQFARALEVVDHEPDGDLTQYEMLMRAKNGRWVPLEIRSRVIREKDVPVGLHCIGRDITERRRIEEERRELALRLMRSQDEERRRLARELHDTTGQNLVALRMNLSLVRDQIAKLDPKLRQALSESADLADQCIRELRTLSYLLHPPLLDERGLASALRLYSEGFSDRSGIAVELEVSDDFGRLPQEIELASFRVVQECLTNVHRHSTSRVAHIRLARSDSKVILEVAGIGDKGPGPAPAALRDAEERGIGIRGMRERMRQLGGKLEIESKPSGMLVRAVLPFQLPDALGNQPLP